jgi:hypothetical protein
LIRRLWTRTPEERRGTLHLFISGPNAFLFYLGQLAHGLGRIPFYEFAFAGGPPGGYVASIGLP